MENGNFRGFPKASTSEDTLRSTLSIYIQQETFCEPRSGAGNNDITVPTEKVERAFQETAGISQIRKAC